jgi:Protein of unknown function DUF115.
MKMHDKRIQWIYNFGDFIFSIVRLLISTKFKKTKPIEKKYNQCLIMGNGPSLIESLEKNKEQLSELDIVAVNFMANSPEYLVYKPAIYILCDPAFWFETPSEDTKKRISDFYKSLAEKTDWHLQLYLPYQAKKEKKIKIILSQNPHICLNYYNKTKVEGFSKFNHWTYHKQWGMPRAQNVLVAALMLAIYSGYKNIYLAGADNDWIKNIWVDEKNNVRLNDFHYYKDTEKNTSRMLSFKLHDTYTLFYFMFRSYTYIETYAVLKNVKIYNTGIKSFIDAFEKKELI